MALKIVSRDSGGRTWPGDLSAYTSIVSGRLSFNLDTKLTESRSLSNRSKISLFMGTDIVAPLSVVPVRVNVLGVKFSTPP